MERPPLPRAASAGALADLSFPPEAEEGHAPLQRPLGVTSERLPQGMRTLHQGYFFRLPALCFSFFLLSLKILLRKPGTFVEGPG
jgi:hypothetical protein